MRRIRVSLLGAASRISAKEWPDEDKWKARRKRRIASSGVEVLLLQRSLPNRAAAWHHGDSAVNSWFKCGTLAPFGICPHFVVPSDITLFGSKSPVSTILVQKPFAVA